MRWAALLLLTPLTTACGADFVDLRPESAINTDGPIEIDVPADDSGSVLKRGTWEGRSDYFGRGSAEIRLDEDGSLAVVLSDDFEVSRVPGPVLVLSRREALGRTIEAGQGDVEIGTVGASGAQAFQIPAGTDDRSFVWVFCKPFGLEVARAALEEIQ